jgi:hypothetical protein
LAFDANGEPTAVTGGSSGAPATITRQVFSGTGSQTVFTLASDPGALGNSAQVYIGGIYQQRSTYTMGGTTLTFSQAPVAGTDNIEFVNFLTDSIGSTSADLVTYTPSGSGAVARSAASKFADVVSVKDFGAVGNGVTDDTTAFNNAWTASNPNPVYVPGGSYAITGTVTGSFVSFGAVTIVGGTVNSLSQYAVNATINGNATVTGDLAINGGDITTTSTTANIVNATATTVNIGGAATAMTIGATTGTTTVRNDLSLSTGNLIIGTSGKGIDFSATANSSGTMTSELLDDYEEGTFTPTITGGVTSPTYTPANGQRGWYTKIGRMVCCVIRIHLNGGTAAANHFKFGGLPFTSESDNVTPGDGVWSYANNLVTNNLPTISGEGSSTEVFLYQNDGTAFLGTEANSITGELIFTIWYRTAT